MRTVPLMIVNNKVIDQAKAKDKKYTIFFNHITNWGTFTEKEYMSKDISNPKHPDHQEFLDMLRTVNKQPNVVHNFNHLIEHKKSFI